MRERDITSADTMITIRVPYTGVSYRCQLPDGSTSEQDSTLAFVGRYGQRRARVIVEAHECSQVLVTSIWHDTDILRVPVTKLYEIADTVNDNGQE